MRRSSTINENEHKGPNPYSLNRHPAKPTLGLRQSDFAVDLNQKPRICCSLLRKWHLHFGVEANVFGLTFLHAIYRCSWYDKAREPLKARAALYVRASSPGQDTGAQETALRE